MTLEQLQEFLFGEFGFCGCGCPEEALATLRDLLQSISDKDAAVNRKDEQGRNEAYSRIEQMLGKYGESGVRYLILYHLDHAGLTEHGSGVDSSWLTGLGEQVLAAIKEFGDKAVGE